MAVFIVGDINPEQTASLVEQNISSRGHSPQGAIVRDYPDEPAEINQAKAVQELVVSEPICYLGFKDLVAAGLDGRDLMRREIMMELVLDIIFGTSEKLYNDLYREDLIDEGFGFEYSAESTYAFTMVGGETKNPDQLYERMMASIKEVIQNGISDEQFERHRRKLLGGYIRRFNSLEFIANNFLAYRFRGSDLFELPVLLQEVKRREALALIEENLNPDRHALSLILPDPNG
jgi:predicted Zn-dependent peptidase